MMVGLVEFMYRLLNPIEEKVRACITLMLLMGN